MRTVIWVQTQFEGFHRWKDAPAEAAFLRNWHRHVFKVKLGVEVKNLDREVEFFQLKGRLDRYLKDSFTGDDSFGQPKNRFELSCEQIATAILSYFKGKFCEVSEDGENGAFVLAADSIPEEPPKATPLSNSRNRPFVGIDAEGPNRGKRLLFIPGSTDPLAAQAAIEKVDREYQYPRAIEGVYYGAGNDLTFREDTFKVLTTFYSTALITVECAQVTKEIYDAAEFTDVVLVSRTPRDALADYIKTFRGAYVVWEGEEKGEIAQYRTPVHDDLFAQDEYL